MAKTKAQAKAETKGQVTGLMGVLPRPAKAFDLTKREWFTGIALAGLLASEDRSTPEVFAIAARTFANALLTELAKCPTKTGDE